MNPKLCSGMQRGTVHRSGVDFGSNAFLGDAADNGACYSLQHWAPLCIAFADERFSFARYIS